MDNIKFGLAISSMSSYHPDYSKLSLYNLIVIAGALVNVTVVLLAIIILYIMRPEISPAIEDEQISQILLDKKRPIKFSSVEMPELPVYITHVGDEQPVVFHFKERKPESAILPVYVMKDNGNNLVSSTTILKTPSQPKELVRLLTINTETATTRSSSMKKRSATSSSSRSSSSTMKRSNIGKNASGMMASDENKKSKMTTR